MDTRAEVRKAKLERAGLAGRLTSVGITDVYTVDLNLDQKGLESSASRLANPVTQDASIDRPQAPEIFDWAVEVGFLPGVTDNVGNTARETLEDLLRLKAGPGMGVYSSQITFLSGQLSRADAELAGYTLANPLIQSIKVKDAGEFKRDGGMGIGVPRVKLDAGAVADTVDIRDLDDQALAKIGKQGIANKDGSRRGPLALDLSYMKAIKEYFRNKGRAPTDVELESIAQTWSEHCKHTIFADPIDEVNEGLFRAYIRKATVEIRKNKGPKDFCVSVFTDNSGAIDFDENYMVTDKVETHNTPSALDPFGGSITGIVGVNRDTIGFGMGGKPVINKYGFCFADPRDTEPLYRDSAKKRRMLSPRRIMDGVVEGVNHGGNCSGIPTPQGFVYFDPGYKGKPLVFVGTVGLVPRTTAGRLTHEKKANPGDLIVMLGGRVGQDGIHGATFSSEVLNEGSPVGAVQIGDPITQKKMSDAIIAEARDAALYTSITDDGAGGLSCSVAEMAKESGGCRVALEKVPLKYPGLEPWKIWISESQERMTLAVPPDKWPAFSALMARRKVEATVIGEFTGSGKCVVTWDGAVVMDVDMDFLHDGLPKRPQTTIKPIPSGSEPDFPVPPALGNALREMLARPNMCGYEFISRQYDHEVQGGSVIKPLQGRGRVNGDASVTRPLQGSGRAVVLSQALFPSYSDIDPYNMAACAIDAAIRNAVAAGASVDRLALLDNFCWCSSDDPVRLGQLKQAVTACYDYAVAYGTPFISGKDSMFNDFSGFDAGGRPVKISVPPTLLVSSIGVMADCRKAVSIDAKMAGDLVYVLGETRAELGGSEYYAWAGEHSKNARFTGKKVPVVDSKKNLALYRALEKAIEGGLIASAVSVHRGGLGYAFARTAMAGMLGMELELKGLAEGKSRDDIVLFSESAGRVVVTVAPGNREAFEEAIQGSPFRLAGKVRADGRFIVKGLDGAAVVESTAEELLASYRSTMGGF
jgi:phosphoribosylformylglycinamidine synthase